MVGFFICIMRKLFKKLRIKIFGWDPLYDCIYNKIPNKFCSHTDGYLCCKSCEYYGKYYIEYESTKIDQNA